MNHMVWENESGGGGKFKHQFKTITKRQTVLRRDVVRVAVHVCTLFPPPIPPNVVWGGIFEGTDIHAILRTQIRAQLRSSAWGINPKQKEPRKMGGDKYSGGGEIITCFR